jgi:hypothetical protein
VHLIEERLHAYAECRIVVSPRALRWVARLDREAAGMGRRGERCVRKVDNKRVHKGLAALAIGGPSDSDVGMMSLLELVDVSEGRVNESAQRVGFRNHPLPNPSMTRGGRSWCFLCSADEDLSGVCQRNLLDAAVWQGRCDILLAIVLTQCRSLWASPTADHSPIGDDGSLPQPCYSSMPILQTLSSWQADLGLVW